MKKVILIIALVFLVNVTFNACRSENKDTKIEQVSSGENKDLELAKYQCPMKCEKDKTYQKKGKCPICEMELRKDKIKKE
jgi:hypothetical protein